MEDNTEIFESPDGGKTVYARRLGETTRRLVQTTAANRAKERLGPCPYPNWGLMAKHEELLLAYKHFLDIQQKYKTWETLTDGSITE